MDGPTWAKLSLNHLDLGSAVDTAAARVAHGELDEAVALLDLFDAFDMTRNISIPLVPH